MTPALRVFLSTAREGVLCINGPRMAWLDIAAG